MTEKKCASCGFENLSSSNFCQKCGNKLEENILLQESDVPVKKSVNNMFPIGIVVILIAGYICYFMGWLPFAKDLSSCLGKPITFVKMTHHTSDFYGEVLVGDFLMVRDENGKVVNIGSVESENRKYNICGIKSGMTKSQVEDIMRKKRNFEQVSPGCYKNSKNTSSLLVVDWEGEKVKAVSYTSFANEEEADGYASLNLYNEVWELIEKGYFRTADSWLSNIDGSDADLVELKNMCDIGNSVETHFEKYEQEGLREDGLVKNVSEINIVKSEEAVESAKKEGKNNIFVITDISLAEANVYDITLKQVSDESSVTLYGKYYKKSLPTEIAQLENNLQSEVSTLQIKDTIYATNSDVIKSAAQVWENFLDIRRNYLENY